MSGDRRIRVLFAIPSLSRGGEGLEQGGPEGVFTTLLQSLDDQRFDLHLVVHHADTSNLLPELDGRVEVSSIHEPGRRSPLRALERYPVPGLARVVRRVHPDVVLATLRMNITCALAKPLFPRDTALVCRVANNVTGALDTQRRTRSGVRHAFSTRLHRYVLRSADTIVAQSEAMAHDIALISPDAAAKVRTVPNPVDVEGLGRGAELPARPPLKPGSPQIVSVGRLHRQKGYDLLLVAFRQLLDRWPDARLRILGEGGDRAALTDQAATLGIADHVDLLGFVDEPAPHLAAADLYVCSSRYEGFSNALAEALAVGTPVVAPDGPAAGRDLVNDVNGVLIPEATVNNLVTGITKALDRSDFDREAIRRDCAQRFSRDAIAREYESVIGAGR